MKITDDMIHAGALAADVTLTEARKVIEAALAAAPQPEPVAWMDDGTTRNGSETTSFRVVTTETKTVMPKASAENFSTPLYTSLSSPRPTSWKR